MEDVHDERRIQTFCLLTMTAVAVGVALYFLSPVLIPFVLALVLVYCLTPVIDVQVRHLRVRRTVAVINTALVGCIVLVLLWFLVRTSVVQMAANTSKYETQLAQMVDDVAEWLPLEELGVDIDEIRGVFGIGPGAPETVPGDGDDQGAEPGDVGSSVESLPAETTPSSMLRMPKLSAAGVVRRLVTAIMSVLSNGLLVLIFMIFIMAGRKSRATDETGLWSEMEARIKRYLVTKVLVSAATGALVGGVLAVLGVEFALVFGVMAFVLNFIPSIGSVVSTLLPLPVVVLAPDLSLIAKILAIVIPGVIQFSIGNLIEPKIMGESLDLHPVVVLLGLIFFGMIWGIIGMLLATPIVAVLKIVLERSEVTAPVGHLLAGRLSTAPVGDGEPEVRRMAEDRGAT